MGYVEGFIVAVPAANKQAYLDMAARVAPIFKEFGVLRHVEAWGDDVPEGKVTDFRRAVKATEEEEIVFSWFEYSDRATRDSANQKIMSDPRMSDMGDMPFDGKRMIYAGFAPLVDEKVGGRMGYVDGMVVAVPEANKDAYRDMAIAQAPAFTEAGATRVVDCWGDDVKDGDVTDYKGAVQATDGEKVVYCWIEWPSKEARDAGWKTVMADPRMQFDWDKAPFDGKRLIYGGFEPILDV